MTDDLLTRAGLPENLRFLLDRYPRPVWPEHPNLGEAARFWLEIHGYFRGMGDTLRLGTADFRAGLIEPAAFQAWLTPRLRQFVGHLEGHHQIEDGHFFPIFRAAEARLMPGFDILERDHEHIHGEIVAVVEGANALLARLEGEADARRRAADAYAAAGDRLLRSLLRHLDDEEDLIVPMILDRTEGALGLR